MTEPPQEVHDLEPDVFQREVRSFEFWFDAVRGYLDGLHYGHAPDTPEVESTDEERDRLITVLCNYCVGETTALEGAGGLIQIAPNHAAKVFLSTQAVDEGRHLEVLIHRLLELGVTNPEEEIACRASRRPGADRVAAEAGTGRGSNVHVLGTGDGRRSADDSQPAGPATGT